MSRIAKDPVNIPDGVTVASENNTINFKGPKGELALWSFKIDSIIL